MLVTTEHFATWIFVKWQPSSGGGKPLISFSSSPVDELAFASMTEAMLPQSVTELPLLNLTVFLPLNVPNMGMRVAIARHHAKHGEGRSVIFLMNPMSYLRLIQANPVSVIRIIDENWDDAWQKLIEHKDNDDTRAISECVMQMRQSLRQLPFNPLQVMESLEPLKPDLDSLTRMIHAINDGQRILFLDHGNRFNPELFIRGILDLFPGTIRQQFSGVFPAPYLKEFMGNSQFKLVYVALSPEKDVNQFLNQLKKDEVSFNVIWNLTTGELHFNEDRSRSDHGSEPSSWHLPHLAAMLQAVHAGDVHHLELEHRKMMERDHVAIEHAYFSQQPASAETWRTCFSLIQRAKKFELSEYVRKFQELALKKAVEVSLDEAIVALERLLQDEAREDRKVDLLQQYLDDVPLSRLASQVERVHVAWCRFLLKEINLSRRNETHQLEDRLLALIRPTLEALPLASPDMLEYMLQLLTVLHERTESVDDLIKHFLFHEEVPSDIKLDLFVKSLKLGFIVIEDPVETFNKLMQQVGDSIAVLDIANVFLHLYPREFRTDIVVDPIIKIVKTLEDLPLHFEKIILFARLAAGRFSLKRQHLHDQFKKLVKPLTPEKTLRQKVEALFSDIVWNPHAVDDNRIRTLASQLRMAHYKKKLRSKMDDDRRVAYQIQFFTEAVQARDPSLIHESLDIVHQQDPSSLELLLDRSRRMLSLIKQFRREKYEIPPLMELKLYYHVIEKLRSKKYRKVASQQVLEEWIIDALTYLESISSQSSIRVTIDATFDELIGTLLDMITNEPDELKRKSYLLYMLPPWLQLANNTLFTQYLDAVLDVTYRSEDWDFFIEWLEHAKTKLVESNLSREVLSQPPWWDEVTLASDSSKKRFNELKNELQALTSREHVKKRLKLVKKVLTDVNKLGHEVLVLLMIWELIDLFLQVENANDEAQQEEQ